MQLLGVSKLQNKYILPPGWFIYSFQPFIGFCLRGFCFIRICCFFTVRNHDVLLDYVGTTQWGPHVGAGVFLWILRNFSEHLFYKTSLDDCFLRFDGTKHKKSNHLNNLSVSNIKASDHIINPLSMRKIIFWFYWLYIWLWTHMRVF